MTAQHSPTHGRPLRTVPTAKAEQRQINTGIAAHAGETVARTERHTGRLAEVVRRRRERDDHRRRADAAEAGACAAAAMPLMVH